jgi:hypothetical protein
LPFFSVGWFGYLLRNQRGYKQAKDPDPLAPYVIRVSNVWDGAPTHMRKIMLESSGVTDAANRQMLISRSWRGLPDEVQVALTKFQMLTEFELSNPVLVAEMVQNEASVRDETPSGSNGYRLAHLQACRCIASDGIRFKREDYAGTNASRDCGDHDGVVCAGRHPRQTAGAECSRRTHHRGAKRECPNRHFRLVFLTVPALVPIRGF